MDEIPPSDFLEAMASPKPDLHTNVCTEVLAMTSQVNVPTDGMLQVPLAALRGDEIAEGGHAGRVPVRILSNVPLPRASFETLRVNRAAVRQVEGLRAGVILVVDEEVMITMTNGGDAVSIWVGTV